MHGTTRFPKPDYQAEHFVDREEALDLVLNKARRIATGESVKRRVIFCRGPRGTGKTWLLRSLERLACDVPVHACFQMLDRNGDVQALRSLISQPRPLLLLLDIDGADEKTLDEFEDRVLGRLVTDPRVLTLMAERGKVHYWMAPELRDKSQDVDLGPFEVPYIQAQIQIQVPGATLDPKDSLKWGGGYPWANYLLSVSLEDGSDPLERCVCAFLEGINGKLRHQFAALSVLRSFDEDRMSHLLRAYSQEFRQQDWQSEAIGDLVSDLVNSTLARYDGEENGYIIDEPLHQVLEAWLWTHERERWADLHQAAYEMYDRRIDDSPQARRWQEEKEYHAKCMQKAGRLLQGAQEEGEENG